ncbi:MAG TPA: hypothetical protein VHL50_04755, partial [Pyrinomonadaceae bacterium]|nr:hypothetical protein [Pyrinomonadaceae bacterium]
MKTKSSDVSTTVAASSTSTSDQNPFTAVDAEFELGVWLAGLESFLDSGSSLFTERIGGRSRDWTNEFRLVHSALLLCLKHAQGLMSTGRTPRSVSADELDEIGMRLRDTAVLSDTIIKASPLDFGEWRAWNAMLLDHLRGGTSVFDRLVRNAEKIAEASIPPKLAEVISNGSLQFGDESDLKAILPRFARVLKWLSKVQEMMDRDEPLKHGVLIFARVHEQTSDVVRYINNRLSRFSDEDAELFRLLDTASYTSSHELRKVFDDELSGLIGVRPAPAVFARTEAAWALLKDGIEQVLVSFAKMADPSVDPFAIFPHWREKFDRSVKLRAELGGLIKDVEKCEQDPNPKLLESLNKRLAEFCGQTMPSLYYKDRDSFERFVEEIRLASSRTDLVPILHRFGAYL